MVSFEKQVGWTTRVILSPGATCLKRLRPSKLDVRRQGGYRKALVLCFGKTDAYDFAGANARNGK